MTTMKSYLIVAHSYREMQKALLKVIKDFQEKGVKTRTYTTEIYGDYYANVHPIEG